MTSMASPVQFDALRFIANFICKVTLTPLSNAVSLDPCCCKINSIAAEKIFGLTNPWTGLCEKQIPCPLCKRAVVKAYYPDTVVQEAVKECFNGFPQGLVEFIKRFICSQSYKQGLTQAVSLIPCCHKINQFITSIVYGRANVLPTSMNKKCLVCSKQVKAYYPDAFFRSISTELEMVRAAKSLLLKVEAYPIYINEERKRHFISIGCRLRDLLLEDRVITFASASEIVAVPALTALGVVPSPRFIFSSHQFRNLFNDHQQISLDANASIFITHISPEICKKIRELTSSDERMHFKLLKELINEIMLPVAKSLKSYFCEGDIKITAFADKDIVCIRTNVSELRLTCTHGDLSSSLPELFKRLISEKIFKFTIQPEQRLFLEDFDKRLLDEMYANKNQSNNGFLKLLNHYLPEGYAVTWQCPGKLDIIREARQGRGLNSVITNNLVIRSLDGFEIELRPSQLSPLPISH